MRIWGPGGVSAAAVFALSLFFADSASAVPIYAGSWRVDDAPSWATLPSAYTGQEAAAFLFGGDPGDYVISTVDDNPDNIDFMAWVSTFDSGLLGLCGGQLPCGTKVAQDFKVSTDGVYRSWGDTSALVNDWALGAEFTNYAFIDSAPVLRAFSSFASFNGPAEIPEPATLFLFGSGLVAAGALRRRRRKT
jgi:hypothetical protein